MFVELHREEKREEGDRDGQEDKRGNRRETDPASNQFPECSAQNSQRDSKSWVEKRKERGEIEVTWWRKRRIKRGREQLGQ